jgi:hypothetical protein
MNRAIWIGLLVISGCSWTDSNGKNHGSAGNGDEKTGAKIEQTYGEMVNAIRNTHQEMRDRFKPSSSGHRYAIETKMTEWIETEYFEKSIAWKCSVETVRKEFLGDRLLCYITPEISEQTLKKHLGDRSLISVSFHVSPDEALRLKHKDEIIVVGRIENCSLDGSVIELVDVSWEFLP